MKEITLSDAGIRPGILKWYNRRFRHTDLTLDANKLLNSAVRKAGHEDFGPEWNTSALDVLVRSINAEARLSPLGAYIVRQRVKSALVNRLRAQKLFKQHPEILEQELADVCLITGMQRTGTTYLQRLLSSDPSARSLYSWEGLDPVPRGDRGETRRRKRMARFNQMALGWISPAFSAIHPVDYRKPEEDVLLLDQTLYTTAHEAMMHVPTFSRWLEQQDHRAAYRWERKLLLLLQWQRPAKRWILKSPHHLEWLDAFSSVFANARIIWTHRDPRECIPSFMSMVYHGRAIFSESPDTYEVSAHWLAKAARTCSRGMAYCLRANNVAHVAYEGLVRNCERSIRDLYATLDYSLDKQTISSIMHESAGHRKNRFGSHSYGLDDFGLAEEDIGSRFENYEQWISMLIEHDE